MATAREVFVRSAWNYDVDEVSYRTGLFCPPEEGMTQQQFAEEADINTIVKRFGLSGEMPETVRIPQSGDFTEVMDFRSAMDVVVAAERGFMELPGEMRARFGHDPQLLMDFLNDGRNRDEAVKLGLVKRPPEVTRDVVAAVDELAAKLAPPVKP